MTSFAEPGDWNQTFKRARSKFFSRAKGEFTRKLENLCWTKVTIVIILKQCHSLPAEERWKLQLELKICAQKKYNIQLLKTAMWVFSRRAKKGLAKGPESVCRTTGAISLLSESTVIVFEKCERRNYDWDELLIRTKVFECHFFRITMS